MKTFQSVLIGAVLAGSFVGVASSAPHGIAVATGDLDLSTTTGIRSLYKRIDQAARTYCKPPHVTGSRIAAIDSHCVDDAVKTTVDKLNIPALTTVYEGDHRRK